jgi:hypothetical protein
MARLISYYIFNQLKNQKNFREEVITGIVEGLKIVLTNFAKMAKPISKDKAMIENACKVYSHGIEDVSTIVSFINEEEANRELIVTKEISRSDHEGRVYTYPSLIFKVGHASHSLINDHLNYRVDIKNPLIVLANDLESETIEKVLEYSREDSRDVLFILKNTSPSAKESLVAYNQKSKNTVALMDLSEDYQRADTIFTQISASLRKFDKITSDSPAEFSTSDRVIMEGG